MKVLHISGSYPPIKDGIGDCAEHTCDLLLRHGVDVKLVTTGDAAVREYLLRKKVFVPVRRLLPNWSLRNLLGLVMDIGAYEYHLVFLEYPGKGYGRQWAMSLLPMLWKVCRRKAKMVVRLHEYGDVCWAHKAVMVVLAAFVDYLVMPERQDLDALCRVLPWLRARSRIVRVAGNIPVAPLDADALHRAKAELDCAEGRQVVTFFGFVYPRKGFEELTRAMMSLVARRADCLWLVIGGFNQPEDEKEWLQLTGQLRQQGRIRYLGYLERTDVSKFLRISDLCVLPFVDGVSLRRGSFLAAMDHGVPVLTIRNPRHDGLLRDGDNILLCDSLRPQLLEEKIVAFLEDPMLRQHLREGVARLDFSWEQIIGEMIGLFDQLAKGEQ